MSWATVPAPRPSPPATTVFLASAGLLCPCSPAHEAQAPDRHPGQLRGHKYCLHQLSPAVCSPGPHCLPGADGQSTAAGVRLLTPCANTLAASPAAIVHTGFQHLMGNLVLLVALAGQLECAYGGWRIAAVCLVAAAGGSLTSGAFEDPCTMVRVSGGTVGTSRGCTDAGCPSAVCAKLQPLQRLHPTSHCLVGMGLSL